MTTFVLIKDDNEFEKVKQEWINKGRQLWNIKFTPPNIAYISDYCHFITIEEVPREVISKFNRYMDDCWK